MNKTVAKFNVSLASHNPQSVYTKKEFNYVLAMEGTWRRLAARIGRRGDVAATAGS